MDGDSVEHIVEAARVLGRYADALGVRAFPRGTDWAIARQDAIIKSFAQHCEKPVINLESRPAAPLPGAGRRDDAPREARRDRGQALRAHLGLASQGAARRRCPPVPRSPRRGSAWRSSSPGPTGYELDPEDTALIRKLAQQSGRRVRAHHRRSRRSAGRRRRGLREVVGLGQAVRQAGGGGGAARRPARLAADARPAPRPPGAAKAS